MDGFFKSVLDDDVEVTEVRVSEDAAKDELWEEGIIKRWCGGGGAE